MTGDSMPEPDRNQRGQIFTAEDGVVVVEWYHFGEDVAYEYADQLLFDQAGQGQIAAVLGIIDMPTPEALKDILKERFGSYQAVRDFADGNTIPYKVKTDMWP
jgi:hypothetical protein